MKIITKFILVLFCLSNSICFSQEKIQHNEHKEAQRVAFYTKKLDLSSAEAEKFWPVYRTMKKEMTLLRKERKPKRQGKIAEMSDQEIETLLDEMLLYKQKELDLKKKYHQQYKNVLPISKVAKLYHAEEQFKKQLQARQYREEIRRSNSPQK